ncbi:MAG: hypothetical protein SF066_11350 [Thermoanaerobaculia bacterium]|nr:hypothetical protein [Thermoanaerobaculia bacterium]
MGDYDARINEIKEQLKSAATEAEERLLKRIEDAVTQWGNERESLLDDLVDHVQRASATNKGTPDRWKSRIDSARQKLGSLFGEAVKDQLLPAGLQLFWAKAIELENGFLESLAAVGTPKLLDDLHAHQAGLGKLIEELADKWRFLLQQNQALESEELRVIDEIDRLLQEVLAKVTPIRQKLLDTTETIESGAQKAIDKVGSSSAAELAAKAVEQIVGADLGKDLETTVEATGSWLSVKVGELKAALSQQERNVKAYRDLLSREKGTVLSIFKQNREQVERYQRENAVEQAKTWRDQATGQLDDWAGDRATSGQQTDGDVFADKIADAIEELWETTEDFDEKFRAEFEGLFWGPLKGDSLEALIEEAKFRERVKALPARATVEQLAGVADQLDDGPGQLVDQALGPLASPPAGLAADSLELLALRNTEFRAKLRSRLESEFGALLPVIADLRKMFEESRLGEDLKRDELRDEID